MKALIDILENKFARLTSGWREVIQGLSSDTLYRRLEGDSRSLSCGEHIVRSARIVEQAFGGITASLWDDAFEWTLPETLPTPEKVLEYLREVDATRQRGFQMFKIDADLTKEIVTPAGETPLLSLLLDTLVSAGHHLLRAREVLKQMRGGAYSIEKSSTTANG